MSQSPTQKNATMIYRSHELFFRTSTTDEAVQLVRRFHYSHRPPGNVQFVGTFHIAGGLFGDYGLAVAAIFFSIPPTRWKEPVLELSRLVRDDACKVPLTRLISLACKAIKNHGHDLLVSFADQSFGHYGIVYQAAGWNYDGRRDRSCDGIVIGGNFVPGRSCNSTWGTRSPTKLCEILQTQVEPHYDEGKHLYWKALCSNGRAKAQRLGLKQAPYPKPNPQ